MHIGRRGKAASYMKLLLTSFTALLALTTLSPADPLGNSFTYQGRLNHNNAPANGSFDLKFELFDAAADGNPAGTPVELPAQNIAGGLFSTDLDFGGPAVFDGTAYWMEVSAKTAGAEEYVKIPGRVAVRPTPNAIHALSAAAVKDGAITENSLADASVTGAKIAPASVGLAQLSAPGIPAAGQVLAFDGADLSWVNPDTLPGNPGIWSLNGNKAFYNNGFVGIGTSNPLAPLHVVANWVSGETPNIRLSGSRPTMMWVRDRGFPEAVSTDYWLAHMSGVTQGNLAFYHRNFNGNVFPAVDTGYRPVMSVTPSLSVGIGTEVPAGKFHVYDGNSVTQVLETGGGVNAWSRIRFKNAAGEWDVGSSRDYNDNQLYFTRSGTGAVQFGIQPNGNVFTQGDVTATRLVLRADPNATMNAAVLCGDANVTNFVPYNTATNRPLNLVTRDATVRRLTITGGADLAEPFAMSHDGLEPGTVVVIDEKNPGKLRRSTHAYDKKVAGIVSGANGIEPGISMIQEDKLEAGENVALSGRVYVKANTAAGIIEPGDLLTTSSTAGEAMKAAKHDKAQGAILGKAMTSLNEGTGMVLVLVTLQ